MTYNCPVFQCYSQSWACASPDVASPHLELHGIPKVYLKLCGNSTLNFTASDAVVFASAVLSLPVVFSTTFSHLDQTSLPSSSLQSSTPLNTFTSSSKSYTLTETAETSYSSGAKYDPGGSQGAQLGLGIGLSIGLPFLVAISILVCVLQRRRSSKEVAEVFPPEEIYGNRSPVLCEAPGRFVRNELYGISLPHEMHAGNPEINNRL